MAKRERRGFTLVELLVVISIIGMLMALLFPAVNSAIGRAKRTQCINNQKEIGQAMLLYENQRERFPGFANHLANRNVSWAVAILKELQRGDLYDMWTDSNHPNFGNAINQSGRLDILVCPVDSRPTLGGSWLSYQVNGGSQDNTNLSPPDYRANGVFHDHRSNVQPQHRTHVSLSYLAAHDGTSTTLMLSEDLRGTTWTGPFGNTEWEDRLAFFWIFGTGGNQPDNRPINRVASNGTLQVNPNLPAAAATRLSSNHPGGVVATFADGHTMFLSELVNTNVYRKLCTPNGAQAINVSNGQVSADPAPPLRDSDYNF